MGALNSIFDVDTYLLSDSPETDATHNKISDTPKCARNKRILSLDPRSPSEEISRTPILVAKTSTSAKLETTNVSNSGSPEAKDTALTPFFARNKGLLAFDPRSPTEAISRTPIIVDKSTSSSEPSTIEFSAFSDLDPRSPTTLFVRTPIIPDGNGANRLQNSHRLDPIYLSSESGIDSKGTSPDTNCQREISSFGSPDSAISHDNESSSEEESEAVEVEMPTSSDECQNNLTPLRVFENSSKGLETEMEETPKTMMFRGPVVKRIQALSNNSTGQRSPLSFVENSPQSRTVKNRLKSNLNLISAVDKENQF